MDGIVPKLSECVKRELKQVVRRSGDAKLVRRRQVILNVSAGVSPTETARVGHVARSTVYRVAGRFCSDGIAGLVDRRKDNGYEELDQQYLERLRRVVGGS